ncbi:MAG: alpha/beta fold hydrolase [Deltaproteobacteria bacterium]|nr:alpha/beta fold hydrolase [Deltaproteobacteria bacterium]MBW2218690.1 alpha/beta fold hydrolase [Deltaproteobacteria bacterium]
MKHATEINITFLSDGFQLSGTLHLPDIPLPPIVIGSHGLLSAGDSPKQISLAHECNQRGMAYLRFDHRGCGQSEGDFVNVTSLESRYKDLVRAIEWIQKRPDIGKKIGLFGSSLGGAAALSVAGTYQVDAVVTLAAPVTGASILKSADASASASTDLKGLPISFYQKCLSFDITEKLPSVSRVLIFHGDADTVVPVSNSRKIYGKAKDPKRLIIQKNGDHRMSDPIHQADFYENAVEWFVKILTP